MSLDKTCSKCHKQKHIEDFDSGHRQCKQCRCQSAVEWNRRNRERYNRNWKRFYESNKKRLRETRRRYNRSPQSKFYLLSKTAAKRGQDCTLSMKEYQTLTSTECHYCGGLLPEAGHGLDRLDNSVGYVLGNCVPCCDVCNCMRGMFWTPEEFKQIAVVVKKLRKEREMMRIEQPRRIRRKRQAI